MRKARAVALEFDGKSYRTINDVTKEFRTGANKIKKLVEEGTLPPWEDIVHGTRKFRHFNDEWMDAARNYFISLKSS